MVIVEGTAWNQHSSQGSGSMFDISPFLIKKKIKISKRGWAFHISSLKFYFIFFSDK
jgi:hypothetical protein